DAGVTQCRPHCFGTLLEPALGVAAERVEADPDDGDARRVHDAAPTGAKAYVTMSRPSASVANGTTTSSSSIPMRNSAGSATVSRASTRTSPGISTYPTPNGVKPPSDARNGGLLGGKPWIVQLHNV